MLNRVVECLRTVTWLILVIVLFCIVETTGWSVVISKTVLYFDSSPGETARQRFTIRNNTAENKAIRIRLIDWDDTPDGRTLLSPPGESARSCASWIKYAPETVDLAPGKEQEISVMMSVPSHAVGTYWAAFLVDSPAQTTLESEQGIRARTQFLIKIYQTALPAKTMGKIVAVDVGGLNPLGVMLEFSNAGETLMKEVHATATLQDRSGQTLGSFSAEPFSVLPGRSTRVLLRSSMYMQVIGIYLITAIVDFGEDYLVAGKLALRIKPLSLSPVGERERLPTDIDGDGLYEDIDGDGRLTKDDVSLFRENLGELSVVQNARAFDYDNDGMITLNDAIFLHAMLSRLAQPPGD
jgi:PKD repeat protein